MTGSDRQAPADGGPLSGVFTGGMEEAVALVARVAEAGSSCILWGESGTGKNLFSCLCHLLGPSKDGPYAEIGCASLPESLVESELFGYVRGAFTGASDDHPGRLRQADGGTLVLDELDSLPPSAQAKILRVVETGRCTPMGGLAPVEIRARFVGLTLEDPRTLVADGRLRADLFYRLAVFSIELPPVRRRLGHFEALADFVVQSEARRLKAPPVQLSDRVRARLSRLPFLGNVRELQNMVRRWTFLKPGQPVSESDLPETADRCQPVPKRLDEVEREAIRQALSFTGGRLGEAAAILGIHRKTLLEKRKRYGIY